MYLFIFESIGTQELILIGIVALIVFGPRKLPELAKTFGRYMTDFRKVTNEFKSTWEKEVEEDTKMLKQLAQDPLKEEDSISTFSQPKEEDTISQAEDEKKLLAPQIKELDPAEFEHIFQNKGIPAESVKNEEIVTEPTTLSKRDWL